MLFNSGIVKVPTLARSIGRVINLTSGCVLQTSRLTFPTMGGSKVQLSPPTVPGGTSHDCLQKVNETRNLRPCVSTITRALKGVDKDRKVAIDLAAHRVQVDSSSADAEELADAIRTRAGPTPVPIGDRPGGCQSVRRLLRLRQSLISGHRSALPASALTRIKAPFDCLERSSPCN